MYMQFQNFLMTGCRYGQKISKMPQEFQKSGSVTFVPLWCPNLMQKILKKTNEIFKNGPTDGKRTDKGNY